MADSELSGLTATTTLDATDIVYVVKDPGGGGEADRKITGANVKASVFTGMVASASTALTGHAPNNTSMEQWATETATVAQASAPASCVVMAWLSGSMGPSAGGAAGDRGEVRLEASFDGGSSYAAIGDSGTIVTIVGTSGKRAGFSVVGRSTGTVTGDVKVRAMVRDVDGANDTDWQDGYIVMLVHPQ